MTTRGYGIFGNANNMFKQYRACISEYFKVKSEIEQKIGQLKKGGHSHFCRKCRALKEHIIAENERFNNCQLRNSKQLKLIDDDDNIKSFVEECIDNPTCFINRTRSSKKTAAPARASAGKDKQQSGGDSKTSKHGGSPIKVSPGQDKNRASGKVITEEKIIPQKPDGINTPHNSGEAQKEASKQIANTPSSASGRIKTQEQKTSPLVHPPVSETYSRPSASIHGTSDGEYDTNKSSHAVDVSEDKAKNNILVDKVVHIDKFKNQGEGGEVPVIVISDAADISFVRDDPGVKTKVDRGVCGATSDEKEPCQTNAVMRASRTASSSDMSAGIVGKDLRYSDEDARGEVSVDVSNAAEITLDEFICSEYDFDEVFSSETLNSALQPDKMNLNTGENTERAVLSQGQKIIVTKGVSELSTCHTTGALLSTSRCVPSNSGAASAVYPHKEIFSGQHENNDQVLSRQDTRELVQSNQQESPQEGQLHYKEELSLREDEHPGGKHYIIQDIVQHLHFQRNCNFRQSIYFPRRERSI
ncbi:hypothetical protein PVT01_000008400 [Plasmodium vivax]|uniref:VIR protein n=1 Tax=Plasmodium vivax TaxID=5855 RepID=A0A1G4EF74_PLAVI|nr:hypothetical protein PVT01_000008400 [Plasmodium vivax]